jgi:hypothetical protein
MFFCVGGRVQNAERGPVVRRGERAGVAVRQYRVAVLQQRGAVFAHAPIGLPVLFLDGRGLALEPRV